MENVHDQWMAEVKKYLASINMAFDKWQSAFPYDFKADHDAGVPAKDAAAKANDFWWKEQDKVFDPRKIHPPTD